MPKRCLTDGGLLGPRPSLSSLKLSQPPALPSSQPSLKPSEALGESHMDKRMDKIGLMEELTFTKIISCLMSGRILLEAITGFEESEANMKEFLQIGISFFLLQEIHMKKQYIIMMVRDGIDV